MHSQEMIGIAAMNRRCGATGGVYFRAERSASRLAHRVSASAGQSASSILRIDTEAIREDAAKRTNTEHDYHAAVTKALEDLLPGPAEEARRAAARAAGEGDQGRGGAVREQGQAQALSLAAHDAADPASQGPSRKQCAHADQSFAAYD